MIFCKEKQIKELQEEIDYLNDAIDFYHHAFLGLSVRMSNIERAFLSMGLAEYKPKKEDLLLN